MGCDIRSFTEVKVDGKWIVDRYGPFVDRDYAWFNFLAGVRNRGLPVICAPRGIPTDCAEENHYPFDYDCHSHSWLTALELCGYDYTQPVPDGEGFRELGDFLGEGFFDVLDDLAFRAIFKGVKLSDIRVVFAFDS